MDKNSQKEKTISGFNGLRKTVEYEEKGKVKYKTVDSELGYVYEERTKEEEENRKETIAAIKKIYQAQNGVAKALDLISGKAPSWKEIEEYTKKDIDFLLQLNDGTTAYQKQRNDRKRKQLEKKYSKEEIEEKLAKLNKEDFKKALSSYGSLEIQKEISGRCK